MKKLKLYLIQIWFANEALKKISTSDLNIATGFHVLKLKEIIGKEFAHIEQQRQELMRKYGANEGVPLPEAAIPEFTKAFNNFLVSNQTDVYVNKIKLSELTSANIRLTPDELAASEFMIDNDLVYEQEEEVDEVIDYTEVEPAKAFTSKSKTKISAELTVVKADPAEDVKDQVLLE